MLSPYEIGHCCYRILHRFLEQNRRLERFVRLEFQGVQLEFFSKRETGLLYEVDRFSAEVSYDLVHNWQRLQFVVDYGELVLWTHNFKRLVRRRFLFQRLVRVSMRFYDTVSFKYD